MSDCLSCNFKAYFLVAQQMFSKAYQPTARRGDVFCRPRNRKPAFSKLGMWWIFYPTTDGTIIRSNAREAVLTGQRQLPHNYWLLRLSTAAKKFWTKMCTTLRNVYESAVVALSGGILERTVGRTKSNMLAEAGESYQCFCGRQAESTWIRHGWAHRKTYRSTRINRDTG